MSDPEIEAVELGEEARNFLSSKLFDKLREIAEEEYESALKDLSTVDPTDIKAIQKLQNQVHLYGSFDEWLRELVSRGDNALQVFQHQNKT